MTCGIPEPKQETAPPSSGGDSQEHEKVAAQLRAEHRRLEFLLSATSAVTYSCGVTPPFGATFVSENLTTLLGYTTHEFVDDPGFWAARVHPDDRERVLAGVAGVFVRGRHAHEYRFLDAHGKYRWLHDEFVLVRDDAGKPTELVGVFFDVSARKEAERSAARSGSNFRALIEALPDGVMVHRDQRIVYANPAMQALLRATRDNEVLGLSPVALAAESQREVVRERIRAVQSTDGPLRTAPMECDLVRLDGTRVPCEVEAMALDFDGAPAVLVIARDMTERRAMRASLAATERLAAMGTVAVGVAHEINNPLSYVLINLALLNEHLPAMVEDRAETPLSKRQVHSLIADANEGAIRVRDVVRDLLALSRQGAEALVPVDVRKVLESCVRLARTDLDHAARLVMRLGEVPLVLATPTRLGQVFLNLLVNAAQAIPAGHVQANEIGILTRTSPDGTAVIEVSDTGPGIPEDIGSRIFEPFFTTKAVGKGTGLGLSICHGIVTSMKGTITFETDARGTTFRVTLPPSGREPRSAPTPGAPPAPARRGRVLVIDDTEAIGATIRILLEALYDVTTLTRAKAALELIARGEEFDVILCDLMMPEMDGTAFFERLSAEAPTLAGRVVFLTGGAFTPQAREFLGRVPNSRMEKPFPSAALLELLATKMAQR